MTKGYKFSGESPLWDSLPIQQLIKEKEQMATSFGDIFKYFMIFEPLIKDAQVAFGKDDGAAKKAAVIDGFNRSLQAGAPFLELSHPRYATMIGIAVQFAYDELKAWGELPPAPVVAPVVPPAPLPVVPLPPVVALPPVPPVVVPPVAVPPAAVDPGRGQWNTLAMPAFTPAGAIPSDADLKAKGFSAGDAKWVAYDTTGAAVAWAVTPAQSLMARGDYARIEQIGIIGA